MIKLKYKFRYSFFWTLISEIWIITTTLLCIILYCRFNVIKNSLKKFGFALIIISNN